MSVAPSVALAIACWVSMSSDSWLEETCTWELSKKCIKDALKITNRANEARDADITNIHDQNVLDVRSVKRAEGPGGREMKIFVATHKRSSADRGGVFVSPLEGACFQLSEGRYGPVQHGWAPGERTCSDTLSPLLTRVWAIDGAAFFDLIFLGNGMPFARDPQCPAMPIPEALVLEDIAGELRGEAIEVEGDGLIRVAFSGHLKSGGKLPYECAITAPFPWLGNIESSRGVSSASFDLDVSGEYEWSPELERVQSLRLKALVVGTEETKGSGVVRGQESNALEVLRVRSWEGRLDLMFQAIEREGDWKEASQ